MPSTFANPLLFLLDANACNARQQLGELNELESMARVGLIELLYTETTWDEAQLGSSDRRGKVEQFFFVGLDNDEENTKLQMAWRNSIAAVVFPSGIANVTERRDVEALLTAKISGGRFITRDGASKTQRGGILGHKHQLAELGIEVLSFSEALTCAQTALNHRF